MKTSSQLNVTNPLPPERKESEPKEPEPKEPEPKEPEPKEFDTYIAKRSSTRWFRNKYMSFMNDELEMGDVVDKFRVSLVNDSNNRMARAAMTKRKFHMNVVPQPELLALFMDSNIPVLKHPLNVYICLYETLGEINGSLTSSLSQKVVSEKYECDHRQIKQVPLSMDLPILPINSHKSIHGTTGNTYEIIIPPQYMIYTLDDSKAEVVNALKKLYNPPHDKRSVIIQAIKYFENHGAKPYRTVEHASKTDKFIQHEFDKLKKIEREINSNGGGRTRNCVNISRRRKKKTNKKKKSRARVVLKKKSYTIRRRRRKGKK